MSAEPASDPARSLPLQVLAALIEAAREAGVSEEDISDFERQMDRAAKKADATAKGIEGRFARLNPKAGNIGLGSFFEGASSGAARLLPLLGRVASGVGIVLAAYEGIKLNDQFNQLANQLKATGLQGEAFNRVFNQLFTSAQKNAAPLESVIGLYSKLAIAQGELGVSSEQLIGFTDTIGAILKQSGTDATQASGALLQLSQALGGGVVRAEEFNSILEGTPNIARAAALGIEEAGGSVAKLRQLVAEGAVSSRALFEGVGRGYVQVAAEGKGAATTLEQATTRVNNALLLLGRTIGETTDASGYAAAAINGVASAIEGLTRVIPNAAEALKGYIAVAAQAVAAANQVQSGSSAIAGIMRTQKALEGIGSGSGYKAPPTPQLFSVEEMNRRGRGAEAIAEQDVQKAVEVYEGAEERIGKALAKLPPPVNKISLADFPVTGGKEPKGRGGGGGKPRGATGQTPDELQREIEQIRQRTAALGIEADSVGSSTFEAEKLKAVHDLLNAARQAGIPISDQLRQQIENEATAFATASQKLEQVRQSQEALQSAWQDFGGAVNEAFDAAIIQGENLDEVLQNLLKRLASMATNQAFQALFGGNSGGFGLLGQILGLGVGGRAIGAGTGALFHRGGIVGQGGMSRHGVSPGVWAGAPRYHAGGIAGLAANEVPAILKRGEMVIPRDAVRGMGAGGGGTTIVVNQSNAFQGGVTHADLARSLPDVKRTAVAAVKEAMVRRNI